MEKQLESGLFINGRNDGYGVVVEELTVLQKRILALLELL